MKNTVDVTLNIYRPDGSKSVMIRTIEKGKSLAEALKETGNSTLKAADGTPYIDHVSGLKEKDEPKLIRRIGYARDIGKD